MFSMEFMFLIPCVCMCALSTGVQVSGIIFP